MNDSFSAYTAVAIAVGSLTAVALAALQSDRATRLILAPKRLAVKRLQSYQYRWSQALQLQKLKLRYYWNGGAGKGDDPTTTILTTEQELNDLVESIVSQKTPTPYKIGSIAKDEKAKGAQDYFLWLFNSQESEVVQVNAVLFGLKLAEALDKKISSSTLCFVSDVAAGTGANFITELMKECCKDTVAVVADGATPTWMIQWALLKERRVYSNTKLQRLLYALCRLETLPFPRAIQTVAVMIPTAVAPILLPALHEVFPDDRHVFCYTGCVQTVQYAEAKRGTFRKAQIPLDLREAISLGKDAVQYTTPVNANLQSSVHIMPPYSQALADLPVETAGTVETWMAAVDTYLVRKQEQQAADFLPYVCKLDYILQDGPLEKNKSARYWSIRSLVQYVTGSASRELTDQKQDAIISWLTDYRPPADAASLTHPLRKQIENCVFQHKLILIANKVLLDTVAPQQHWTLKQAMKRGCACCIPDDDPDGEAFFARRNAAFASAANSRSTTTDGASGFAFDPTAVSAKLAQSRGYVDGKSVFAFDPTQFR